MRAHNHAWEAGVYGGLLAGDESALGEAYDELAPLVYGIAVRSTGDVAAAEELTERAFLRLWEKPMDFSPDRGPLRLLLCEMTRRWAIEHVRRAGVRSRTPALATVSGGHEGPPPEGRTETGVVRDALLDLPAHQRDAVLLAYFQGLTYQQIAKELGIAEDLARSGLHDGLCRLTGLLAEADQVPAGLSDHCA